MDVASHNSGNRIVYVITKGTWGGAQRYVFELACAAREAGHVVTVACGTPGELVRRLEELAIPVVLIPGLARDIRMGSDIRALIALVRLIHRERPHTVHGNSSKAGLLASLAGRIAGVPRIIFTAHGWAWNELRPGWQKVAFKILHYATVVLAHHVIAVSEAVSTQASWMPFIDRKITVIRHGVSPLPLLPRSESRAFLREHIGPQLADTAWWIGALAELHPTKGLDTLIHALARIRTTHPEAVLILIGAGQDRGRLTALAHMLRVEQYVFFAGHIEHAARLLPALDIFAFPSRSEALGYAALEAGQAMLPVVASNVGGIPEIIVHEETGLLVTPGDEEELARAITRMRDDHELRTRLAESLSRKVHENFTVQTMHERTFELY